MVPGKAAQFAKDHDIPRAYDSHLEMIEKERLDAVSVCTPNFSHKQTTIDALEAGLHVLCEKPIAMNLAEGEAMVAAARRTGKTLQIGLHWRFTSEAQVLKRFIEAGDLGDIYYGEATYWRRRGIPGWGVFTQKRPRGAQSTSASTPWTHDVADGQPDTVSVMVRRIRQQAIRRRQRLGPLGPATFDVDDAAMAMVR